MGQPLVQAAAAPINHTHLRVLRGVFSAGRRYAVAQLDGVHLDLIASGLLQVVEPESRLTDGYSRLQLTDTGLARLHAFRQEKVRSLKPHASLAERLAAHLRDRGMLTWLNVQIAKAGRTGVARPDVYALSGKNLIATASQSMVVEVKVSRSDWRAELKNPAKLTAYAGMAERVYVCSPEGLVQPDEVPPGVGLIHEMGQGGSFVIKRRARRQKGFAPPADVLLTLLVRMHSAHQRERDQEGLEGATGVAAESTIAGSSLACA